MLYERGVVRDCVELVRAAAAAGLVPAVLDANGRCSRRLLMAVRARGGQTPAPPTPADLLAVTPVDDPPAAAPEASSSALARASSATSSTLTPGSLLAERWVALDGFEEAETMASQATILQEDDDDYVAEVGREADFLRAVSYRRAQDRPGSD